MNEVNKENMQPETTTQENIQNQSMEEVKTVEKTNLLDKIDKRIIIVGGILIILASIFSFLYWAKIIRFNTKEKVKYYDEPISADDEPINNGTADIIDPNDALAKNKTIDIYEYKWSGWDEDHGVNYTYNVYTDNKDNFNDTDGGKYTFKKVGSFECVSDFCYPINDYSNTYSDKYVLAYESNNTISLYDYKEGKLVYNKKMVDENKDKNDFGTDIFPKFGEVYYGLLKDDKTVYGFYESYEKTENEWYTNIYNLSNNKFYTNLKGQYNYPYLFAKIVDKKYLPLSNDDNTLLFDIESGKKVFEAEGYLFDELHINNKTYILLGEALYDINGKTIFKDIIHEYHDDSKFVFSKNNKFYIYDNNLKLVKESKKYTDVIDIYKDYVLVKNGKAIQLIDYNDDCVATFIKDFDDKKQSLHIPISGWYTANGKNGIYIVVGDNSVTYDEVKKTDSTVTKDQFDSEDKGYEYYYIPKTKEIGRIPTLVGGYAKPVLYLYPTKKTKVTVNFEHEDMLTTTYPKFNKEWSVTAKPNGDLYDKKGNYYYALYWEENGNHKVDFSKGFYVEKDNAIDFLEEKLSYIGLNKKERNEFIMYWLPILEKNKKNLVYFELTEERDLYNKLIINPKPDSLLRIAIHVKRVNKKTNIEEQKLTKFNRKGFTAVEWGGVTYN